MTKADCIWVAIRVLGLLFLYKVVVAAVGLINSLALASTMLFGLKAMNPNDADAYSAALKQAMKASSFATPVELLIYGLMAWYFLKGAPVVSRYITRFGAEKPAA